MKASLISTALAIAGLCAGAAHAQGARAADGKTLYAKNCAACHQATGRGIPGAFPPLVGSAIVIGPTTEATEVLLTGRGGMPDFSGSLDDADIAAVLTYARANWGNQAAPVSSAEVQAQRVALKVGLANHNRFGNKH